MAHVSLDFGVHRGKALQYVPTGYLLFTLERMRLSARVVEAIRVELKHRGVPVPSASSAVCPKCGPSAGVAYGWMVEGGRNVIKRTCRRCGRRLDADAAGARIGNPGVAGSAVGASATTATANGDGSR